MPLAAQNEATGPPQQYDESGQSAVLLHPHCPLIQTGSTSCQKTADLLHLKAAMGARHAGTKTFAPAQQPPPTEVHPLLGAALRGSRVTVTTRARACVRSRRNDAAVAVGLACDQRRRVCYTRRPRCGALRIGVADTLRAARSHRARLMGPADGAGCHRDEIDAAAENLVVHTERRARR